MGTGWGFAATQTYTCSLYCAPSHDKSLMRGRKLLQTCVCLCGPTASARVSHKDTTCWSGCARASQALTYAMTFPHHLSLSHQGPSFRGLGGEVVCSSRKVCALLRALPPTESLSRFFLKYHPCLPFLLLGEFLLWQIANTRFAPCPDLPARPQMAF